MSKLKIISGTASIILGIVLLFISPTTIIPGILIIILGIGFIIFRRDENIIEERQDLNKRKAG
jgi:hypothetical protein